MPTNGIVTSIGLISDTHFQDRLFELPDQLAQVWGKVDLILHAGDVGDLDVLDRLGKIAPVVAVHGNDEPAQTKQELPYQQLLTVHGVRLLLWHSHYSDPVEEHAKRVGAWGPKLERNGARGLEAGAAIVVYGHTHVPFTHLHQGVTVFNPGALASGSYFTRQKTPSVGLLQIMSDQSYTIKHLDLDSGQPREFPTPLAEDRFNLLADQYQEWLIEPGLIPQVAAIRKIPYENIRGVMHSFLHLYKRTVKAGLIQRRELIEALQTSDLITPNDRQQILAVLESIA